MDTQFNPGQVAELIGCHRTTVLRKIRCGQIGATQIVNNRNQPEYQISISSLPPSAQEKYYAQQRAALALTVETETAEPKASKPFDAYSEAEREEIVFWEHVVQQWGGYARKKGESEAELLERFLAWLRLEYPERSWSKATLYRKRKALEDGDLDGLVDGRGKTKLPREAGAGGRGGIPGVLPAGDPAPERAGGHVGRGRIPCGTHAGQAAAALVQHILPLRAEHPAAAAGAGYLRRKGLAG